MELNQLIFCNPELKWTPESLKDKLILIPKTFTPFIDGDKIDSKLTKQNSTISIDKTSKIDNSEPINDNNIYTGANGIRKIKCEKIKPIHVNNDTFEYSPRDRSPTENMGHYDFNNIINSKNDRSPMRRFKNNKDNRDISSKSSHMVFM